MTVTNAVANIRLWWKWLTVKADKHTNISVSSVINKLESNIIQHNPRAEVADGAKHTDLLHYRCYFVSKKICRRCHRVFKIFSLAFIGRIKFQEKVDFNTSTKSKDLWQGTLTWKGWISTIDLLVLTSSDQLRFILKKLHFFSFINQAILTRRLTVLSLPLQ